MREYFLHFIKLLSYVKKKGHLRVAFFMYRLVIYNEKIMLRGGWSPQSTLIRYMRAWDLMDDG